MGTTITVTIDGHNIQAQPGQTIVEAADEAGVYIPRLCYLKGLSPFGSCRICTVRANGRTQAACTTPVAPGMIIENDTEEMHALRRDLLDMLFVSGNHFCMFCEKSGNCELQALAYRHGITAPRFPYLFPDKHVDASHPDVLIDHNRCVLCTRCVRSSRELDDKHAFGVTGRGYGKRIAPNAREHMAETDLAVDDHAVQNCPTGTILRKRVGYAVPVGKRLFDHEPIGADIEKRGQEAAGEVKS